MISLKIKGVINRKMKCLIIAAGKGTRLQSKGDSKPLISLLGLTLIERVILTAQKSGITEFFIVTGYKCKKVECFLEDLSREKNIKIKTIINNEWEKENGLSVLKAKDYLNENFILLMADHVFDASILEKLISKKIKDDEIMLAVDCNIKKNKNVDIDDVTKVFVKNDKILNIGKNIKEYNAYDTGIFLCSPAIFSALEESNTRNNDSTLSGGVRILAKKGKAGICDINKSFWIDIDDKKTLRKAKRLLYGSLAKSGDGIIAKYINRKFSISVFTPFFLTFFKKITPNQASIISFIVALISSLSFILGHAIIGALLLQLASILDGSDGEIARLKHSESELGNFFDAILDRVSDTLILLSIFYFTLTTIGNKAIFGINISYLLVFMVSGFAILGNLMVSYTSTKSVANFNYKYKGKIIAAGRGRDIRLFLLFLGGLLTYFHPISLLFTLFVIAILTNTIVLWRVILSYSYSKNKNYLINSSIKAIIFDFDGTIADTMPFLTKLAVELIIKNYNITKEEAKKKYLETTGLDFATQIQTIFSNHPNNKEAINDFETKKLENLFSQSLFPEVITTLKYFKSQKIKSFICSSTKQKIITEYIKLNKIDHLLDSCFGYKPNFEKNKQIDFVLQQFNMQPQDILFVGDSLKDCDFAVNKKIEFMGISKIFKKIEFQRKGALSVYNLSELVKLFKKSKLYSKYIEYV